MTLEAPINEAELRFREQHKLRLSYMPWLYWTLKPRHKAWAEQWQHDWQMYLCSVETVVIEGPCFIAPQARLFAEPGRPITIGEGSFIAADTFIHGPVNIGRHVSINHHCTLDGGRRGVVIDDNSRLAAYCSIYAFNHRHSMHCPMREQGVSSEGVHIGKDVWLGAHVGVTDGVRIGDHAVVGMNSTVTRSVLAKQKVAGAPAKPIGWRD